MKILIRISRIITGIVFAFSGFVKAIDPLGVTYKFVDYFEDAYHLPQLAFTSFPLAIIMTAAEFIVGISLLLNLKPKLGLLGALIFMLFFTPVTLYLAIANPVHDCGCFGDAVVITNWQTFYKNLVILAIVIFAFIKRKELPNLLSNQKQWIIVIAFTVSIILFQIWTVMHLPIIDFRPYKIGNDIKEKMSIPEGVERDEYKTTLTYKNTKTGEVKEFPLENYPWSDSTWVWQATNSVLVKKGYEPPIHDFTMVDTSGADFTEMILNEEKPVLLVIVYKLDKASETGLIKSKSLIEIANKNNWIINFLTSNNWDEIKEIKSKYNLDATFYQTDEITLKTIVRANPGLMLLKKGIVKGKWHYNDFPDENKINKKLK